MKNEVRETALSGAKINGIKFPDQAIASSLPHENNEQRKALSERCLELKLELEKARRIL
jgi:hypothetical protein